MGPSPPLVVMLQKTTRIPTTSLRTGLGMTDLSYERAFSSPIKSVPSCGVIARKPTKRRPRRIQRGGFEEVFRFSRRANGWKSADTMVQPVRRLVSESVLPSGRPTTPLRMSGSGSGSVVESIPRSGGAYAATLAHKRKSRNHRFLAAFFAYFLLLLAKSMPPEASAESPTDTQRELPPRGYLPISSADFLRQVLTNLSDFSNMIEKTGRILEETVWNCIRLWPEIFTASASPSG